MIAEPIHISAEINIVKNFSLGLSGLNVEYNDYHSMQIAAETAMYEAQKNSASKYIIAPSRPALTLLHRKLIIDELPHAIEECKIKVHYQPQYDLNTRQLIGFEALSRWEHESIGDIPPEVFVAIAEEIGFNFEFDLCVFEQVCLQIMLWRKQNIAVTRIAINISFKTMEMSNFIERLQFIINKTNCPISLIELEVTETSSINNIKTLSANIAKVKDLGIMISVDDFGTGYSSLSLILEFHLSFDKLKLDRRFIDNICDVTLDRHFAEHIIELSKILKVKVLAEGVETRQQYDLLTELGFDYGQGYYFSKALTANEAAKLMIKKSVIKQAHIVCNREGEICLLP